MKYNVLSKIKFYINYVFYRLIIILECKKGFLRIYLAESIWIINQIFKTHYKLPNLFATKYFETIFGKFSIPSDLVSTIEVSPAFEREDINYLIKLISAEVSKKNKILFVDIGANFGLYSVVIGNKFKRKNLDIIAFEPNTTYLNLPTYAYLKQNIKLNNLKKVKVHKIGIGSRNTKTPNKEGFTTRTLDTVLGINFFKKYDVVFIKLDVDDFVVDALKGIQNSVNNIKKTILLVEDFVDKKSIEYLSQNYDFNKKLSTYNSFWFLNNE